MLNIQEFLKSGALYPVSDETVLLNWGRAKWCPSGSGPNAVFAPDFFLRSTTPWRVSECSAIVPRTQLTALLAAELHKNNAALSEVVFEDPDFLDFSKLFSKLKKAIEAGEIRKAVPVSYGFARVALEESRVAHLLLQMIRHSGKLKPYGWWDVAGGSGLFGITPEVLFTYRAGHLATMAVAGTLAVAGPSAEQKQVFLQDEKERAEHQLVVDDIQAVLSKLGHCRVGETGVLELPHLAHLKTEIELVGEVKFMEAVEKMHPTPALGVAPRAKGLDWIASWDRIVDRGQFGAPFGVDLPNEQFSEALVAIRGVQWRDGLCVLPTGCGVVVASVLEKEWQELGHKRASVRKMLAI